MVAPNYQYQVDENGIITLPQEVVVQGYRTFAFFVDFTLWWESGGEHRLDPTDAIMHYVHAVQNFANWTTMDVIIPRGVGKTTFGVYADTWMRWHFTYAKSLFLSATPDVCSDIFLHSLKLARDHPMLGKLRPLVNVDVDKMQYDTAGHRGKGRSFRVRTAAQRKTGGRCNFLWIDDLEIAETITNPAQRSKMRAVLSEAQNLHFKKDPLRRTIKQGTPWDQDTIYRDMYADVHIEIPAMIRTADGELHYPFRRLDEDQLRIERQGMKNDAMFRAQYLLDTTRDEDSMPIRLQDLRFSAFSHTSLSHRCIIIDPAGGTETAAKLRAIREGDVRGDGMTVAALGVDNSVMKALDIWSDCASASLMLMKMENMLRDYDIPLILIEQNFGGWYVSVRMYLERRGLARRCRVEPFHTSSKVKERRYSDFTKYKTGGNKLSKILRNLVPATQNGNIEFHERLQHHQGLHAQVKDLRWHTLPTKDDILDVLAMGCEHYAEYLHLADGEWYKPPAKPPNPDGTVDPPPLHSIPMNQLEQAVAPVSVRRLWGTQGGKIVPGAKRYG